MNDGVNPGSAEETLESLLHIGGAPLLAAYTARLRALDVSSDGPEATATDDQERATLHDALRQCVVHSADVEQIVALAADVSRARGAVAERRARRAMQSLDWALRDLFLDRYTLVHRQQYVAATGLFLDLLRRRTATQGMLQAPLPAPMHVHADRRINSPRAADTLHS